MAMRRDFGILLLAGALGVWPCAAQSKPSSEPAPCSVAPQPDPCGMTPAPSGKSAVQKFPFPGEPGAPAAQDSHMPSLTGAPDAPGAAGPSPTAATKKFPFPGETSQTTPGSTPDSGSSSSSSSSSGDAPQLDPGAAPGSSGTGKDADSATPGRHILHRVNPIGTKLESADERESEDLDVARFYIGSGDLKAAYMRAQDAVKTAPDDPGAHFLLADVALKLNKRDEAIAEYSACLKLDPIPKQAKDARKALARLKP
ncbi:MAG TPA: hypothetical protein VGU23_03695 [Acidobacteriaceae bacterium]|nr:hypothetical protein [Acidobacteriaceae bacterium]